MIRRLTTLVALGVLAVLPATALPFGTIQGYILGNGPFNAEHEMITRAALSCAVPDKVVNCFEPRSINNLAGQAGTFGAVGAADNYTNIGWIGSGGPDWWHCDNADAFADVLPGYPVSLDAARQRLLECRAYVVAEMTTGATGTPFAASGTANGALGSVKALLNAKGQVDARDLSFSSCTFNLATGRAKCNVLESFGRALHAVQDFYSHSNWADGPNPGQAVSITNPPGLGNTTVADFWNLDTPAAGVTVPTGLGTGCYPTGSCAGRVSHDQGVNKDRVVVDWTGGANAGVACTKGATTVCTPRGLVGTNEQDAVRDAIADTRRQWAWLQQQIVTQEGTDRGARIICAISRDNINTVCNPSAGGATLVRTTDTRPPQVPALLPVTGAVRRCGSTPTAAGATASGIRAQGLDCTAAKRLVRKYAALPRTTAMRTEGTYTTVVESGGLSGLRIIVHVHDATTPGTEAVRLRYRAQRVLFTPACVAPEAGGSSTCGF